MHDEAHTGRLCAYDYGIEAELLTKSGHLEGVAHGYIRHGMTTLFAAPNSAMGEVIAQCK